MQEELVSFETSKLAKEKGFDWETYDAFIENQTYRCPLTEQFNSKGFPKKAISRPTQSLLQKWLREVHGINIFMTFKPNIKKWDFIPYFMNMNAKEYIEYNSEYTKIHNERRFDTYEEALELGLQEALKLI
jgi:hypothetical protein